MGVFCTATKPESTVSYDYCPACATALEDREIEGNSRRACPACDFIHYDNPLPVIAAIVERGEEVVLVRNVGWPDTWYGLVSGFLEKEESPEEGIVREIEEELGVKAEVVSLVGAYGFAQMNQVIIAYHTRIAEDAELVLGDELADSKLVATAKLKPWPFGTGAAVRDWLAAYRDA